MAPPPFAFRFIADKSGGEMTKEVVCMPLMLPLLCLSATRIGVLGAHRTHTVNGASHMADPSDLFAYAKTRVDNKGIAARIGHSAKLHSGRSMFKSPGSFASKGSALLATGARAALSAIPIPGVGDIVSTISVAVEKAVRSHLHTKRQGAAEASGNLAERVKFEMKELSVEEMDRYRWKVSDAIKECNMAISAFPAKLQAATAASAPCSAYYGLALAYAQVDRRLDKLRMHALSTAAAMVRAMQWANDCQFGPNAIEAVDAGAWETGPSRPAVDGVDGNKNKFRQQAADYIKAELASMEAAELAKKGGGDAYIASHHSACGDWCCFNAAGKVDKYATARQRAADITRTLADVFSLDDVITGIQTGADGAGSKE